MKKTILTASWFAVAVYCILTGLYGPAGLVVTARAEESVAAMQKNMEFLEKLNKGYASEWNALRSDASLTAVQGRSLGFIASDEVVVRVALPAPTTSPAFIGERVLFVPGPSMTIAGIRLASLFVWLGTLLAGLGFKLLGGWKSLVQRCLPGDRFQRKMRNQEASRT